jgi:hypothetical protein
MGNPCVMLVPEDESAVTGGEFNNGANFAPLPPEDDEELRPEEGEVGVIEGDPLR